MAGWLDGVKIRRHVCLSKAFLDVAHALIFIAFCLNLRKLHAQPDAAEEAAQNAGFLSLDCGNTEANYTDSNWLNWVADDGYILTGNSSEELFQNSSLARPLRSFRYFPEHRSKYCYELQTPNLTYLFRASFYLNETLLHTQKPFKFIVSIDATNWFSIQDGDGSDEDLFIVQEGVFSPPWGVTNFCLQPVYGVPFISSLELRNLPYSSTIGQLYEYSGLGFQYLALNIRLNLGADSNSPDVRFPDDPLDRIWKTPDVSQNDKFPSVSIPEAPDNTTTIDAIFVPPKVMKDAWLMDYNFGDYAIFPAYANGTQCFLTTPGLEAFVVLYSEYLDSSTSSSYNLQVDLDPNNSAAVDYTSNNFSRQAVAVAMDSFYPGSDTINISLGLFDMQNKPVNVTLGPTMNAIEIYTQCDYNSSLTNYPEDDDVITDMQTGFSLTDWQGDPCVPVPYDWLSCIAIQSHRQTTFYISSVNIFDNVHTDFINVNASSKNTLSYLNEMSITNSRVDDQASKILINYCPSGLTILNFSSNALTSLRASLPTTAVNTLDSLVVLDLSYNQLNDEISIFDEWIQKNSQSLQVVNVSNNNLSGTFNSSLYFSRIPNLVVANFDQNSIEGVLDLSLWYDAVQQASNSNATSGDQNRVGVGLKLFSFVNNSISNVIPSVETIASPIENLLKQDLSFSSNGILLGGNPYCKHVKSLPQRYLCRSTITENIKEDKKGNKNILIIGICSGFVALLLCCATFATVWRLLRQVYSLQEIQKALADREVQPPFYQYSDLKQATRDFSNHNKLGAGGFGIVYKGVLADQTSLAVKKLFISQHAQALDEFLNEVILITGIKHRNLIQLKGCCIKDKERMLVYEYAENGNLAEALWGSKRLGNFNWAMRFNICLGVARGLSYLHEGLQPSIIHRDIKPENILLDRDLRPKIADFGLARQFLGETTQAQYTQVSKIAGTRGYFAPEYAMHGQLSEKADVYSYGILVLEVVSGRKCINLSLPSGQQILVDWAVSMQKEELLFDVLQAELRHTCDAMEVIRVLSIGLLCTHHDPTRRPSMSQIVTMLMGNMDTASFLGDLDNVRSSFKNNYIVSDFNIKYPTLEVIEENSAIFPLIGVVSGSSSRITRRESNSAPLVELSSIRGR